MAFEETICVQKLLLALKFVKSARNKDERERVCSGPLYIQYRENIVSDSQRLFLKSDALALRHIVWQVHLILLIISPVIRA